MKQLLHKFRNMLSGPAVETPQVRRRITVLNEAIQEGRKSSRVAEPNEIAANEDGYNSSDYDCGDSWRNGRDR